MVLSQKEKLALSMAIQILCDKRNTERYSMARVVSADRETMAYREDAVGLLVKIRDESEADHAE